MLYYCVIRGTLTELIKGQLKMSKSISEYCHSCPRQKNKQRKKEQHMNTNDPSRTFEKLRQKDGPLNTHCISMHFNPHSDMSHCTLWTFVGLVVQQPALTGAFQGPRWRGKSVSPGLHLCLSPGSLLYFTITVISCDLAWWLAISYVVFTSYVNNYFIRYVILFF